MRVIYLDSVVTENGKFPYMPVRTRSVILTTGREVDYNILLMSSFLSSFEGSLCSLSLCLGWGCMCWCKNGLLLGRFFVRGRLSLIFRYCGWFLSCFLLVRVTYFGLLGSLSPVYNIYLIGWWGSVGDGSHLSPHVVLFMLLFPPLVPFYLDKKFPG